MYYTQDEVKEFLNKVESQLIELTKSSAEMGSNEELYVWISKGRVITTTSLASGNGYQREYESVDDKIMRKEVISFASMEEVDNG